MPAFGGKTPRAFRTWLLVGLACLAFVGCRAEITSNETPFGDRELPANEVDDVSLEELRDALIDDLLGDLAERALRIYGGRKPFDSNLINLASGWRVKPGGFQKKGGTSFAGANRLTNLASGFHKKSSNDEGGQWDAFAEDKRGRGFFNDRLTNLKSGFTKRSDDEAAQETDVKRGGSMFSNRLTNLASGFAKRGDDESGHFGEDKRGRSTFSGASRLTNLSSGFKRSGVDEGHWEDSKDKRGRSAFGSASRLTNLSSGFKRDGNFNVGPMVHIPSGFTEKRADGTDSL